VSATASPIQVTVPSHEREITVQIVLEKLELYIQIIITRHEPVKEEVFFMSRDSLHNTMFKIVQEKPQILIYRTFQYRTE
jgi:hypothetical protein